jgi:hypothetical protein
MPRKESPVAARKTIFSRTDPAGAGGNDSPVEKPKRIKRTFHIEPELVLLLDEMQLQEHRTSGRKPELSSLVGEAIRLLANSRYPELQASRQVDG